MLENVLTTRRGDSLVQSVPWVAWFAASSATLGVAYTSLAASGPLRAWLLLATVVGGLKFIVLAAASKAERERLSSVRVIAFMLLWPGMTLRPFEATCERLPAPRRWWIAGLTNVVFGIVLLDIACYWTSVRPPEMARAMLGLVGSGLTVLFGVFQLLAVMWRSVGVAVERQWNWLWGMRGVANYWSVRWNRAFHDFARQHVYAPLRRRLPPSAALLGTFVFSGLAHEILMSVPAQGGYGGPTLYFVLQGCGIIVERRFILAGAGRRLWAWFVVLAPLGLLFHPPFIRHVVLPQLDVWGGL